MLPGLAPESDPGISDTREMLSLQGDTRHPTAGLFPYACPNQPQQQVPSLLETPRDTQLHDPLQRPTEGEKDGCGFSEAQSAHKGLTQAGRETPRGPPFQKLSPGAGAQMLFPPVLAFSPSYFSLPLRSNTQQACQDTIPALRFRICHHRYEVRRKLQCWRFSASSSLRQTNPTVNKPQTNQPTK